MMEALWGPRRGGSAGPQDVARAAPAVDATPPGDATVAPGPAVEALRGEIAGLRSELSAMVAAVESRIGERMEVLLREAVAASAGAAEAPAVTAADLGGLRADLESQMVEQLRQVMAEAEARIDARAAELATQVSGPPDGTVGREEFVALQAELRNALTRNMSSAQAELKRRVSSLDATVVDLKMQVSARLHEMATLVATEAAAAAERATLAARQQRFP
jgi:hypothetical protein